MTYAFELPMRDIVAIVRGAKRALFLPANGITAGDGITLGCPEILGAVNARAVDVIALPAFGENVLIELAVESIEARLHDYL